MEVTGLNVHVVAYGGLRQVVGARGREVTDLPAAATVDQLLERLAADEPTLAAHLDTVVCAVGDSIVSRATVLRDGFEISLLPPVSGG
jgi:molybdopterin converting factor small subunit